MAPEHKLRTIKAPIHPRSLHRRAGARGCAQGHGGQRRDARLGCHGGGHSGPSLVSRPPHLPRSLPAPEEAVKKAGESVLTGPRATRIIRTEVTMALKPPRTLKTPPGAPDHFTVEE